MTWNLSLADAALAVALALSTIFTLILITLPSQYDNRQQSQDGGAKKKYKTSVQIVVLGDIGRSPRMEYHAISIAKNGGRVDIVGVLVSDLHPELVKLDGIRVVPISQSPTVLQTSNKLLVLLFAPIQAIWQACSLYYALGYKCEPAEWILMQNPPFIPTFAIVSLLAFIRRSKLIVDWHNFGYSLYALKFGDSHPLVKLHRWYEFRASQVAHTHFTVTNAMASALKQRADIVAHPLHDRPPNHFQPLTGAQQKAFLQTFAPVSGSKKAKNWRLLVSSTSWTPDEDFSILLDALASYSKDMVNDSKLPEIVAVITGKGPQKEHYKQRVQQMKQSGKLNGVEIHTAWLSNQDYALLLGSADLGVSLHTSSSGLDLPMKVVDMFGTGLPVAGWRKFEAWPELVQEGVNGRGFGSAAELKDILVELFASDGRQLQTLRRGAMKESEQRWDAEWNDVAGRILGLTPS